MAEKSKASNVLSIVKCARLVDVEHGHQPPNRLTLRRKTHGCREFGDVDLAIAIAVSDAELLQ